MRHRSWILVICLLTAVSLLAGCDRVSDRAGSDARLLVTSDYGRTVRSTDGLAAGHSVLDGLRATHTVETEFGGGFVSSIDGLRTTTSPARDWFYYVNGMYAGHGAAEQIVRAGDQIWWDHRAWQGHPTASGVVGDWPQPFVNGYPSRPAAVSADPPLDSVLKERGVNIVPGDAPYRVRVDADDALSRRDPAWRRARGASDSELVARVQGDHVQVIDDAGRWWTPPGGRAVAVLVITGSTAEDGGALLAVAGVTEGDARRAADTIARDPEVLAHRYGVAFDGGGKPVATAGWARP